MAGASTLAGSHRPEPDAARLDPFPSPGRTHFRPDIEGLRAVAVGLVVADHVVGWPAGGFIGVDVFFVISGFLITSLLVRERARTGRISFGGFYARRARRLFPAAFLTLAATTTVAWFVFLSGRFQETVTDVAWAALFSANVNFARDGTDYFDATTAPSLVQHFWSLAVEEQFYLVWPALILLAFALPMAGTRRRRVMIGGVLGAVTAASFAWSVHATGVSPATAYFSTFTRAWELGLGALVAVAAPQLQQVPAALRAVLAWCGLSGVLASVFLVDDGTPFPGTAAVLPVVSAALLVAWGGAPGGPGTRWLLASAPAGFLGAISYSLYLWHWPVLIIAGAVVLPGSATFSAGVIGVSLLLASFSYYCIEQPVLHTNWLLSHRPVDPVRARRVFLRARKVGVAAVGAGAMAAWALVAVLPAGGGQAHASAAREAAEANQAAVEQGRSPLTSLQQEIEAATLATEWPADLDPSMDELPGYLPKQWAAGCLHVSEVNVRDCLYGDPDAEKSIAVLGDSFAAAWLPALRQELVPAGWSVQSLTLGLCPNITSLTLFDDQPFPGCIEHREWALEHILETRPDIVLLTHSWEAQLPAGADEAAVFRTQYPEVVRRVQASGTEIVMLGAPPGSASLLECPTALNGPADCLRGPQDDFATQMAGEREVAAETGVRFIDSEQWFCVHGLCPTFVGSTPVYGDGAHVTAEYVRHIAPEVVAAILQR